MRSSLPAHPAQSRDSPIFSATFGVLPTSGGPSQWTTYRTSACSSKRSNLQGRTMDLSRSLMHPAARLACTQTELTAPVRPRPRHQTQPRSPVPPIPPLPPLPLLVHVHPPSSPPPPPSLPPPRPHHDPATPPCATPPRTGGRTARTSRSAGSGGACSRSSAPSLGIGVWTTMCVPGWWEWRGGVRARGERGGSGERPGEGREGTPDLALSEWGISSWSPALRVVSTA